MSKPKTPHPLDDHECREVARSAARKMALELVTACRQDLEAYDLETRIHGPSPIPREYYTNALARALERLECAP